MTKAAVYSPYLDSLGGGERYILTVAEVLSEDFDKVDILLDSHLQQLDLDQIKDKLIHRFKLNLEKISFIDAPLGEGSSRSKRNQFLKEYDFFFCLTDGSLFTSSAKKSVLHIQTPLKSSKSSVLLNWYKLKSWDLIVYNSKFTQKHASKYWKKKSIVIYPPVSVSDLKSSEKKNIILSVGRFFGYLREKKHELMISAFKSLVDQAKLKNWKLVLAGSALDGDQPYLDELSSLIKGYPIELKPNLGYNNLLDLYGESSIYWHAMGFEEDDPTKMEHFGITTVEAMAAGCVPIVINKGGQSEIVKDKESGFLWSSIEELHDLTENVINNQKLRDQIARSARVRAELFSKERFKEHIRSLYT